MVWNCIWSEIRWKIDVTEICRALFRCGQALDDNTGCGESSGWQFRVPTHHGGALNPQALYKYAAYLQAGCNRVLEFIRHMNIVERIRFLRQREVRGHQLVYPGNTFQLCGSR